MYFTDYPYVFGLTSFKMTFINLTLHDTMVDFCFMRYKSMMGQFVPVSFRIDYLYVCVNFFYSTIQLDSFIKRKSYANFYSQMYAVYL